MEGDEGFGGDFEGGGLSVLEGGFPESVQNGQTYPF